MRAALKPILFNSVPGWVRNAYGLLVPDIVSQFHEGRAWVRGVGIVDPASLITTVRASNETTLLPSSASGVAYQTLPSNVPAIVPGSGLQAFQAAITNLLNSTAPVTQTTASLGTGTYTLWVNGSGSATSSAGSATGSGFGAATNGSPNTFTLTGAGTVTVTKTGSLNAFQLESGASGTPLIVTAGATATRAAAAITMAIDNSRLTVGSLYTKVIWPTFNGVSNVFVEGNNGASLVGASITMTSATNYEIDARNGATAGGRGATNTNAGLSAGATARFGLSWDSATTPNGAFNGSPVAVTSFTPAQADWAGSSLSIGSRGAGNSLFANTYIQDVAVWYNKKLSAAQLAAFL